MIGRDGHWNRAGRRSGGNRPVEIAVPRVVSCSCGTTTAFGLLPHRLLGGEVEVKTCPSCEGVLFALVDGAWVTADATAPQERT